MCNWKNGINLIKLAESFFLKYSYRALQRPQLALYEKGFERPASLASLVHYQSTVHRPCMSAVGRNCHCPRAARARGLI